MCELTQMQATGDMLIERDVHLLGIRWFDEYLSVLNWFYKVEEESVMTTLMNSNDMVGSASPRFAVRKVDSEASMRWLNAGIKDFKAAMPTSIAYGMIYVTLGLLVIWLSSAKPIFTTSLVTGFLIVGPIVAVVFYRISRALEQGHSARFSQGFEDLRFNSVSLVSFAMVLGILMGIWAVISSVTVALFFNSLTITDHWFDTLVSHEQFVPFLLVWSVTGAAVVVFAFAISAISVPLMTDKRVDVMTAMITSVKAVRANPKVMWSWAFILATLVFLGFAFFFVGLAITLPIAGYGSWHAYRELIAEE